jgi:hypothetical protein
LGSCLEGSSDTNTPTFDESAIVCGAATEAGCCGGIETGQAGGGTGETGFAQGTGNVVRVANVVAKVGSVEIVWSSCRAPRCSIIEITDLEANKDIAPELVVFRMKFNG